MGDTDDVLNRLRAMLDHGPKPPSRYDPPRAEEVVNKEVENLRKENRLLKRDNEDLKRQLDSSDQNSQAEISSHREILTQASEALIKSTSEITSLKLEIKDQASLVHEERQKRQVAESVANGSKTQLSQIAREKHELEVRVKRAEGAEVELKRLMEVNRNLELSNTSLRKQIASGAGQFQTRATIDGLQEKAKTAELKVAKLTDQLRHVRLQNDALRIQVEESTGQASQSSFHPSLPSKSKVKVKSLSRGQVNRSCQSSNTQRLVKLRPPPSSPSSILQLDRSLERPKTAISQILGFMTQNIHYIFEHLPPFIKSLIGIYRSFSSSSTTTKTKKLGLGATQGEDTVQKLMSEKGAYKNALKEKELEIMKLAEKLEDQKKQNRAYVEQFKAQERESQRYRSKKKERAFLKAIPIIPPTPSIFTPAPTPLVHRDLQVLSEGTGDETDFTDDLAQLADLTGRQQESESQCSKRKKAERRSKLIDESNREQSRFQFAPSKMDRKPKSGNGSMDDLVREIKQMAVKKPDPYGDIEKAFGLDADPPKPKKSMVATVEDEDEPPRQRVARKGSPINSRAERYGDAYA